MHQRRFGDDGVGDYDGLAQRVFDGGVAPAHVLHHTGLRTHLNVVPRPDNSHKRYLQAADKVGKRVLKTQRDRDTSNTQGGDDRVGVDVIDDVEDDACAQDQYGRADNVDNDGRGRQGIAVPVEDMPHGASDYARGGECRQS